MEVFLKRKVIRDNTIFLINLNWRKILLMKVEAGIKTILITQILFFAKFQLQKGGYEKSLKFFIERF